MNRHRILLVDDDPSLLKLLSIRLQANNFDIETASNGSKALNKLTSFQPHLIITDLRMRGMGGLDLFKAIHQQFPTLPVIILTAHGTIPDAINATHMGVFSFLTKPFDSEGLLKTIERALSQGYTCNDKDIENNDQHWRHKIISQSAVIEELLGQAWRIAQSNVSTLIQSDSGTGKELLAQAIHNASPRHNAPFIPVNCAAIPEPLLESELFGHRKGAFTGATHNRTGLFETANKGTLFLDEIGNMPMEFQVKLLRVLEDGKVRPMGTSATIPVDVRIISATNIDLEAAIEANNFREDLFYRLNVVMLKIPPLRDRREDIPLLANHFLHRACDRTEQTMASSFSPEAMEALMMAPWPGNVRQLLNVVEQVVALSVTSVISASLIRNALHIKTCTVVPLVKARIDFERNYLVHILQMTRGNVTQAALLAKRNRTEFYKLLNRHQLEPALFRRS
ncbi:MAG: sigma 54-interacting transcriptional regulator [Candidatus Polarisedimenticolaceae bacterium]|nr:sigma 54-interacting transcriptional regulator [Candidatus Polarisedimenticolaceae bacterium]